MPEKPEPPAPPSKISKKPRSSASLSKMPRKPKSSAHFLSSSFNDGTSGNYPPDTPDTPDTTQIKMHPTPVKYSSKQQERLNHLTFGLGCCRWTVNVERLIRDVWLHIPEERGGGEGIGLLPRQVLQYCRSRGTSLPDGDEKFEEFLLWLMAQPEYVNNLPTPVPYQADRSQVRVDTPPLEFSLDSAPNMPMEGPFFTPIGPFQSQDEMVGMPPIEYFYSPPPPPGSFLGPLWSVETPPPPPPMTSMQATVEHAYYRQSPALQEDDCTKFFQMVDDILPDRPRYPATSPAPTAGMYPPIQGTPPVSAFHAARATTVATAALAAASLAAASATAPSEMSPRSRVASRVGEASGSLLLALSPEPTATPPAHADIFCLKVRYTANGIEYLAMTPGLVSVTVRWENLLQNIIEYEVVVKNKGAIGFLMKSPGFIGLSVSQGVGYM